RRVSGSVSRTKSIRACGRQLTEADARYKVQMTEAGPRAGISGLWRCGKAHLCADCAGKVREKRAARVAAAALSWLALGGHLAFSTFTIARRPGEPLTVATKALTDVNARFVRLVRDSGWIDHAQVVGNVESWEWTIDTRLDGSGHPHMMRLYFFTNTRTLGDWHRWIAPLWSKAASDCGRHASYDFGVRIEHPEANEHGVIEVLSDYLTKGAETWGAGRELCRSDLKKPRDLERSLAPFEVLDVIAETGEGATAWREYEAASKGKATARFSRGPERTIEAAAATGNRLDGTPLQTDDDEGDQVAEEEASVTDATNLEGQTVLVLDGAAQAQPMTMTSCKTHPRPHRERGPHRPTPEPGLTSSTT
ncbi:MAG: hypothetical protein R2705_22235, partial [Ilumatobacteraceae bacterium]